MIKLLGTLLVMLLFTLTLSCNNEERTTIDPGETEKSGPILISTTIYPLYDIARQIGGTQIEAKLILPPGESPHTFSPTAQDKRILDASEKIFVISHLLDDWVFESVKDSAKIVPVDTKIHLLPFDGDESDHDESDHDESDHDESGHDKHSGHKHGEFDPHYWLNPMNAIQIANNIAKEYGEIDPSNRDYYQDRANLFSESVAEQYTELLEQSESIKGKSFFTVHNGWSYFAEAFGLRLAGTFEPASGDNPTPRHLKNLQDSIHAEGATVIFSEPQLSTDSIYAFAEDNNLKVVVLDPIGGNSQTQSYQELISFNIETLVENLR